MIHEQIITYVPKDHSRPNPEFEKQRDAVLARIEEATCDNEKLELIVGMRGLKEDIDPWTVDEFMRYIAESTKYAITCVEMGEHKYKRTGRDEFGLKVSFDDKKRASFDENLATVKDEMIMNCL